MEYYWELIQHDGTRIEIPPEAVATVKRRWDKGEPIHTSTGSIPANQIKKFQQTDKAFTTTPLLEAAAQAFGEPMFKEDGSVKARWVKKNVTQDRWNRHFAALPSYRQLGEFNGMVTIAFVLPIHQIDATSLSYCTDEEIRSLTNK